jgi:hypothetical protein
MHASSSLSSKFRAAAASSDEDDHTGRSFVSAREDEYACIRRVRPL